ncbi:MAG: ATP-binding protein, partial [Myxococcota bacterium]
MNKRSTATHAQTSASASTSVAGTALSRSVTPERRTRRVRTALLGAVFTVALVLAGLSVLYLLSDRPGALIAAMLGSGLALTALVAVTGWYYEREHRRARQHFTEAVLELRQANTEFARARDEAQASSRGKSDFLAVMSHEIRTPMNAILGMSGLLLETELSTEQHKYATVVRSSGQSLLALINEILDYTKYEAGKLELEEVDFDLTELVEDCAEMFAANAHDKGLELVCDIDPSAPVSVRSDPARLRQILGNLLGNAIKFTNEGEVVVRVGPAEDGVARADREHPRVLIQVDDTGIGVEPGDRVRLFEAFTQADSSTQRRHGGTGLGLAIAKRLCELLGGEIGVTSAPGTGSRFWVTIPLSRGEVPADDDTPTVPSRGKSSKPGRALGQRASSNGLRGARVLIADRCATRRDMLDRLFVAWGMTCEVAATGDSALGLAHAAARRGR